MVTPVFICTGFLDSGKTTLVKETLMEQEWIEPGLTLLIVCEEGEEEYPEEYLKEKEMILLNIEEPDQLNSTFFKNCEKNYHPAQVVIEYNGMWKLQDLLMIKSPRNWELQGVYSTVNGMTVDMYLLIRAKRLNGRLMSWNIPRMNWQEICFVTGQESLVCLFRISIILFSQRSHGKQRFRFINWDIKRWSVIRSEAVTESVII